MEQWQHDLIGRLERGLGRPLTHIDLPFVAWDTNGRTLSVVSRPLLDELRSNNLKSNVFRTWRPGPATLGALD